MSKKQEKKSQIPKKRKKCPKNGKNLPNISKKRQKFLKNRKKIKKNIENSGQTDKYIENTLKILKSWQKPPKIQRKRQIC